jgi:hypothetical protein
VYFTPDDVLPALFQFLSLSQVVKYRRLYHARRTGSDLLAGYFYDVSWDGGAIAGAPQSP